MRISEAVLVFLMMSAICVISGCEKQLLRPSMIMDDAEDMSLHGLGILDTKNFFLIIPLFGCFLRGFL